MNGVFYFYFVAWSLTLEHWKVRTRKTAPPVTRLKPPIHRMQIQAFTNPGTHIVPPSKALTHFWETLDAPGLAWPNQMTDLWDGDDSESYSPDGTAAPASVSLSSAIWDHSIPRKQDKGSAMLNPKTLGWAHTVSGILGQILSSHTGWIGDWQAQWYQGLTSSTMTHDTSLPHRQKSHLNKTHGYKVISN